MKNDKKQHQELTQKYSTWGDKLLQHADVLNSIQNEKKFKPITVQLCPCEICDSDCPFCSVAGRPLKSSMKFEQIQQILSDFRDLGAKAVEITGGGNPMLYRDKIAKKDINDIVNFASSLGYDIGIITNSHNLKTLQSETQEKLSWVRISLIQLDEGKEPEDYDFNGLPYEKLGFSYIIYDSCSSSPRKEKAYVGTSEATIKKIARLMELHDGKIKFVRFAGNCLIRGNNSLVRKTFDQILESNDQYKKFFLKTIDDDDGPFDDGCYVGLVRPYVAASPEGDEYLVYTCSSHVLNKRTYDRSYSLCNIADIKDAWAKMNQRYASGQAPYEVNGNGGCGWDETCKHCYYKFNNKLLHTVANVMPDKNFA